MKRFFLSFSLILFSTFIFFSSLSAQVQKPVKWRWEAKNISAHSADLIFTADIESNWYVYATKINGTGPIPTQIELEKSSKYSSLNTIKEISKAFEKYDSSFGFVLGVHKKNAIFSQSVKFNTAGKIEVTGTLTYMTCNNVTCLAPEDIDFVISIDVPGQKKDAEEILVNSEKIVDSSVASITPIKIDSVHLSDNPVKPIETEVIAEKENLWNAFLQALGWGLLALLMPCVFPLIPMTVSFFLKSGENKKSSRANASIFSLSIVVIFLIIGLPLSLLFGATFANEMSTHWALNVPLFIIFLLFAASFFGMFEIVLPASWVNMADKHSGKSGLAGTFFMALTTVLVSFSCTVPIVGAVLFSSSTGDFTSAFIKMFGFALAIALPFGFFAFFPNMLKSLPKSGSWMNTLKVVLGFLELALGLKFLSVADLTYHWGILDREVFLSIWIVIFSLMGMYLLGKLKFAHDSDLPHLGVPRLIMAIVTFSFVVYMIPGLWGAPLKALSGYLPPMTTQDFDLSKIQTNNGNIAPSTLCDKPKYSDFLHLPHGLEGYFDYEQALACAREKNKPLLIDFTGHGCANCRKMEEKVWSDPSVLKRLKENFIIVSLYVDDKTSLPESEWITSSIDGKVKKTIGKKWADFSVSRFNVNAQPYYAIIDNNENVLVDPKGMELNIEEYVRFLDEAVKKYTEKVN